MSVVLQLKEQRDKLKERKFSLILSADASIKAAKDLLAVSAVSQLHEIELKTAAAHLNQAIKDQDELGEIMADIRKVERELGL